MAITRSLQDNEVEKFIESSSVSGQPAIAVVNPDGSNIGGGEGGTGIASYSDSGGTDKKGLVDGDRHVQVDVLTMPEATIDTTGLATSANQSTANTALAAIETAVEGTLTVDGSGVTQPVSHAALTELAAAINLSQVDVNIAASAVSLGGTSAADDADFTDGTTPGTPAMGVYELTPSTVTDGDLGLVGITQDRQLKVKHTDAIPVTDNGGNLSIDDGGNTITVDGTVAVTNAGLTELAAAIDTEVQVDVVGALPAGNNNIGDVDVASSVLPTGAATSANQTTVIGHLDGVETLLGTIDADTGGILTSVQTLDNAISGSEMQVDVVAALPAGTNNIGDVDILSIAAGDNNIGNVDIASIAAGNNNIGDVDVATIAAGTNAIGNVGLIGRASGGLSIFRSLDLDESEEEVKGTAGQVFSITAFNTTDAPLYLKFYNATAANVSVGSTTPVLTFLVPGNADSDGAGFVWNNDIGLAFGTAISVAATTGVADADTGAPGANACIVNIGYV